MAQQKVVVDCATGHASMQDLTPAEVTAYTTQQSIGQQQAQADSAKQQQRQSDIQTLKTAAATDPVLAALARLLGAL
jgi:hypothetical protein